MNVDSEQFTNLISLDPLLETIWTHLLNLNEINFELHSENEFSIFL